MDLRAASPTYDRVMGNFEAAAKQFSETGFFEAFDPKPNGEKSWHQRWKAHERECPVSKTIMRKVMRKVASELKRPIIIAETDYWHEAGIRTRVKLRRTKNNAPVIAQFLLLNEPDGGRYSSGKKPGVYSGQDGTNWYVTFLGDKGQKIFRQWKEQVVADPACRKAMKLPPLEPELKLAA
jgi:hypothetical protein